MLQDSEGRGGIGELAGRALSKADEPPWSGGPEGGIRPIIRGLMGAPVTEVRLVRRHGGAEVRPLALLAGTDPVDSWT